VVSFVRVGLHSTCCCNPARRRDRGGEGASEIDAGGAGAAQRATASAPLVKAVKEARRKGERGSVASVDGSTRASPSVAAPPVPVAGVFWFSTGVEPPLRYRAAVSVAIKLNVYVPVDDALLPVGGVMYPDHCARKSVGATFGAGGALDQFASIVGSTSCISTGFTGGKVNTGVVVPPGIAL